jgi:hypothetical protein
MHNGHPIKKIKERNLLLKIEVPLLMMKSHIGIFDVELVAGKEGNITVKEKKVPYHS